MPIPLMVAAAGVKAGADIYGAYQESKARNKEIKETKKQNRYSRWLAGRQNIINEREYSQDRPGVMRANALEEEMKRMEYLKWLQSRNEVV